MMSRFWSRKKILRSRPVASASLAMTGRPRNDVRAPGFAEGEDFAGPSASPSSALIAATSAGVQGHVVVVVVELVLVAVDLCPSTAVQVMP